MTEPKTLKQLSNFDAWDCKKSTTQTPKPCATSIKCALSFKMENVTDTRYMETCRSECPAVYPWLGDSEGTGIQGKDNYVYQINASKEKELGEEGGLEEEETTK
jgi:hypothetical protein